MNFPLITWETVVGPITVNGTLYNSTQSRYGFGITNTVTKDAAADTIADYLRDAINSVMGVGTVVVARYVYSDGTYPANSPLAIEWVNTTNTAIPIDFGSLAMAQKFGFSSSTTILPASGTLTTTINPAGFWGPAGLAGDVRRMLTQRAASSSSDMSGLSTDVVNWGAVADLEMMSTMFCAANYTRWFANIQIYANAANRQIGDPNNTLEGLIEAAAEGKTMRLYRQAALLAGTTPDTYQVCRMPGVSNKGAAADYVTAADEPRLWSTAGLILRGET